MQYVYGHDEAVANFTAALIPHVGDRGFGPHIKAMGVIDEDGKLIAGVVFHNYDPDAGIIEISGAALDKRWITRETIARIYQYPFLFCGCQMVIQRVPADSENVLRILAAYGYTFIKIPRLFGRERDGVLCTLTYEDWIDNKFNKRFRHYLPEQQEAA